MTYFLIQVRSFGGMTALQDLHLENNRISVINKQIFRGLHDLSCLYLSGNNIASVEMGSFSRLGNLEKLHLENNTVSRLEMLSFTCLKVVSSNRFLYLRYNRKSAIDNGFFTGLPDFHHQNLNDENIYKIRINSFDKQHEQQDPHVHGKVISVIEISRLQISDWYKRKKCHNRKCHLHVIEVMSATPNNIVMLGLSGHCTFLAEVKISEIVKLYLIGNNISDVQENAFRRLTALNVLNMADNRISVLKAGIFNSLSQCVWLNLDNNSISVIQKGALDSLYSLKMLSLALNRFTSLSPDLFVNLPRPLHLVLSSSIHESKADNPWNCSSLCWLKYEAQHKTIYPEHGLTCEDGTNWSTIQCHDQGKFSSCFTWSELIFP